MRLSSRTREPAPSARAARPWVRPLPNPAQPPMNISSSSTILAWSLHSCEVHAREAGGRQDRQHLKRAVANRVRKRHTICARGRPSAAPSPRGRCRCTRAIPRREPARGGCRATARYWRAKLAPAMNMNTMMIQSNAARSVAGERQRVRRKAAGGHGGHRMTDGVEQRHARQHERRDLRDRERRVQSPQRDRRLTQLRGQLLVRWAPRLRRRTARARRSPVAAALRRTSAITPSPPSQCVRARQKNTPRPMAEKSVTTVAPVVVRPDIDSNSALT